MVVEAETLKQAMRKWTTGISVVTARDGEHIHGLTVNSFTSVSLDPPLVIVSLANQARTCAMILKTHLFGITILGDEQVDLAERFSGKIEKGEDRFDHLEPFSLASGVPFLPGGLAFLECRVQQTLSLGGSTLFLGEVVSTATTEKDNPLVYHNRHYHRLEK